MNFTSTDRELQDFDFRTITTRTLFHAWLCCSPKRPVNKLSPFFTFRDIFFIPIPIGFLHDPIKGGVIGGYINPPFDLGAGGLELGLGT